VCIRIRHGRAYGHRLAMLSDCNANGRARRWHGVTMLALWLDTAGICKEVDCGCFMIFVF